MAFIINGTNTPIAGAVAVGDGTTLAFTAVGTAGQVLQSNGTSSPSFTSTPVLGTPASGTLTNATGLPLTTGVTGTLPVLNGGTGVTTATGTGSVVLSASPTFTGTVAAAALTLSGDLIVNGTTTTINSTTLAVDDKNLELGSIATPTNTTADGGGITLKGTTDKTFNWVNATSAWTSSEHVATAAGKNILISGSSSGTTTISAAATASGTLTLPAATDTLVGRATTDTLTNKTLTSPTLTTPVLGTPTSGTLTNATGLPLTTGVTGTLPVTNGGTGVTTVTGTGSVVLSTSPTLVTPALGSPSSGALFNCTVDGVYKVGYLEIPVNSQSAAYTTVLADSGKLIFHPSTDATARTFTIQSNANAPYPVGTAITFINMTAAVVSIGINSDTMYLSSAGTTGTRSLAQYGSATAIKMTSTTWLISGSGLT